MSNKRKISLILDKNQLNAPYVGNIKIIFKNLIFNLHFL